ncbi:MAG: hypothetical protein WCC36_11790 [Gammaproteobacteria bacterium]
MNRLLLAVTLAAAMAPAFAADVGVSISVGQPGFYGRRDIGGYPQPQVIYRRPIAIDRVPMNRPPIYLRVPPGHAKHWSRYCRQYHACGERVFFVQDHWYQREYVPRYQRQHRGRHDGNMGEQRGNQRNDRHGNDRRGGGPQHGGDR